MSAVFDWLDRASKSNNPQIKKAADIMKDYYQGVSPRRASEQREREEIYARRKTTEEND